MNCNTKLARVVETGFFIPRFVERDARQFGEMRRLTETLFHFRLVKTRWLNSRDPGPVCLGPLVVPALPRPRRTHPSLLQRPRLPTTASFLREASRQLEGVGSPSQNRTICDRVLVLYYIILLQSLICKNSDNFPQISYDLNLFLFKQRFLTKYLIQSTSLFCPANYSPVAFGA